MNIKLVKPREFIPELCKKCLHLMLAPTKNRCYLWNKGHCDCEPKEPLPHPIIPLLEEIMDCINDDLIDTAMDLLQMLHNRIWEDYE